MFSHLNRTSTAVHIQSVQITSVWILEYRHSSWLTIAVRRCEQPLLRPHGGFADDAVLGSLSGWVLSLAHMTSITHMIAGWGIIDHTLVDTSAHAMTRVINSGSPTLTWDSPSGVLGLKNRLAVVKPLHQSKSLKMTIKFYMSNAAPSMHNWLIPNLICVLGYEVHGMEKIPDEGPALIVYYHGAIPVDYYYFLAHVIIQKGRTCHSVADHFLFKIPGTVHTDPCANVNTEHTLNTFPERLCHHSSPDAPWNHL